MNAGRMNLTWNNSLASAGIVLIAVSLVSWFVGLLVALPDGGEFATSLAFIAGVAGSFLILALVVACRVWRQTLSRLQIVAASAAVLCLIWNVSIVVLLLQAYCCCPDGLC